MGDDFGLRAHTTAYHRPTAPPHHRTTAPPRHHSTAPPRHRATAPPLHHSTTQGTVAQVRFHRKPTLTGGPGGESGCDLVGGDIQTVCYVPRDGIGGGTGTVDGEDRGGIGGRGSSSSGVFLVTSKTKSSVYVFSVRLKFLYKVDLDAKQRGIQQVGAPTQHAWRVASRISYRAPPPPCTCSPPTAGRF